MHMASKFINVITVLEKNEMKMKPPIRLMVQRNMRKLSHDQQNKKKKYLRINLNKKVKDYKTLKQKLKRFN